MTEIFLLDTDAIVLYRDPDFIRVRTIATDLDNRVDVVPPVFNGIGNKILKQLFHLKGDCFNNRQTIDLYRGATFTDH